MIYAKIIAIRVQVEPKIGTAIQEALGVTCVVNETVSAAVSYHVRFLTGGQTISAAACTII